jgi:type I restriction enzyme S subunit
LIAGYWDTETDVYIGSLPVIVFGDHTRILKLGSL